MAKDNNYFEMFNKMGDYACQSAELLYDTLKNFDFATLTAKREILHKIEHDADVCKHELTNKLVKEFITPIEREDIVLLSKVIDDVTDCIEDVLIRIYMYNIKEIRPEAKVFSEIMLKCSSALRDALEEFHNFKKSTIIHDKIVEVNRLEEVGDRIYTDAIRTLFSMPHDAPLLMAWSEIFEKMEDSCDACEHVADVIESVIMKNT